MEAMREAWTDERLDDLNHRVDELSHRVDDGFREVRTEFAALQRLLVQLFGGMFATVFVGFLATLLTQH